MNINIKAAFFRIICINLIISLFFEMNCATTRRYPISKFHPKELLGEESIIVIMKNGKHFNLTNISVTNTHLVGIIKSSVPPRKSKLIETIKIIKLEDIAYVQLIQPPPSSTEAKECIYILAAIGVLGLIFLIECQNAQH